jgi:hypothetical protein
MWRGWEEADGGAGHGDSSQVNGERKQVEGQADGES